MALHWTPALLIHDTIAMTVQRRILFPGGSKEFAATSIGQRTVVLALFRYGGPDGINWVNSPSYPRRETKRAAQISACLHLAMGAAARWIKKGYPPAALSFPSEER
jgi:hypothetical protein